ncbi:MAG TPA: DNA/RNA non-specific endonuclease, partial [Pyrinomonadaceae bacterium]
WVSWHLSDEWIGTLTRVDTFRADPQVPADWFRVSEFDYVGSGFDRGHMVPNADRDKETSVPINQATFLMTNMIPQSPNNNQGPWADLEAYLRTQLPANEVYIVAGGAGTGGVGSNGAASTIAGGNVTVPAQTWKVALIMPKGSGDDVARVTCSTRTLAVIMPNIQGLSTNWEDFIKTVDEVETLTGYDFFSNLPDAVENCVEAGTNGVNKPGTANQSATTPEDTPVEITLEAVRPSNTTPLTFSIVTSPTNGVLGSVGATSCVDLECSATVTYTPGTNYNGSDSFTFKVNDGTQDSNTSTVNITVTPVNDDPVLTSSVAMTLISSTNSNLFNVGLSASATDVDGDTVTIQVAVFGDEDDQTPTINSTVHSPDAKDIAPNTLRLRGERVEANDGRVYLIVVTATDGSGGTDRSYHTVVVPKNNKQANINAVIAEAAAAQAFAEANGGTPPAGYFVIGDGAIIGPKQ